MTVRTVGLLTAGGIAPCLSSAVGGLIERYTQVAPEVRIVGYLDGYAGLLTGRSVEVTDEVRSQASRLHDFGGSPLGNSRVKLTNAADCERRGLVRAGEDPLRTAAAQLAADGVDVLHTIGGDDTNTTAADLAAHLAAEGHAMRVVGLPKTIDNDIVPILQSLGAWTAAEQGALFARNIIGEHSSNPRMLVVHEVMGRHSGWLTAETARRYRADLATRRFVPGIGNDPRRWDVHGVYVPELPLDLAGEGRRLRAVMDEIGCVNLFVAEGAGVADVVASMEASGHEVPRDPFGHVQLDLVNPGEYLASTFAEALGAEKAKVWKSGYFARAAAPNQEDLELIRRCTELAVTAALDGRSGVVGQDEERGDELRVVEFDRIAGGGAFDPGVDWFADLLSDIGQHPHNRSDSR
ncbi:pyrophosphate--fructose-6-phosphate 1-phosphotransferase [Janibacter terrae]|uniref:Pyrophosphate--fructose-6-phosphate 1-phosphotransferase n=1 Tax=Janibacter terrae TaxID=103817 RepID=A0ABZ2F9L5_9MICO|nr:pyrophosphate--fructose-6-phosphate 1-phosphotransferase [Janibacter terrae]MBA4085109.1 pyrophosphate--fructose-6-phosphate 1-phosphotransferase [Kytococcus sp.]